MSGGNFLSGWTFSLGIDLDLIFLIPPDLLVVNPSPLSCFCITLKLWKCTFTNEVQSCYLNGYIATGRKPLSTVFLTVRCVFLKRKVSDHTCITTWDINDQMEKEKLKETTRYSLARSLLNLNTGQHLKMQIIMKQFVFLSFLSLKLKYLLLLYSTFIPHSFFF